MARSGLSRGQVAILGAGLVASLASWLAFQPWNLTARFMIGAPFGRDFANFWIGPRLVLEGRGALLGDLDAYNAALSETFGLGVNMAQVFSYPPHILPLLLPLALLPFLPALILFTGLNLAGLAAALRLCAGGAATPRRGLTLLVLLSPAAAAMVMFGHFTGLLALAATVALLRAEDRPHLAGLCLALLSTKPQCALVLGVVLLGAGHWRWIPAAASGTLALVGLSLALFGLEPWRLFLTVTVSVQSAFLTDFRPLKVATVCSVFMSARYWGLPAEAAWAIQGAVSAAALATAVLVLRQGRPGPAALCTVLLGAIVAMPYANHYDVAIAAPALTLLALDRGVSPAPSPLVVVAWLLVPLARILTAVDMPILSLVLAGVVFAQGWRLLRRPVPGPAFLSTGTLPC